MVFRVLFEGDDLREGRDVLMIENVVWEGSASAPSEPSRHRALAEADGGQAAISMVQGAVGHFGTYTNYSASIVTNARGEPWRGPIIRSWDEIDWERTPELAKLSELERNALWALGDAGEPTWIVVGDQDVPSQDRAEVERALTRLEDDGLVHSTVASSGEPGRAEEPDRWWAITDECWDLLGLIKSPGYW